MLVHIDCACTQCYLVYVCANFLEVGPSQDPSGINFVDNVEVYARTKESFGWPEHPPESLPKSNGTSTTEESTSDLMPFFTSKPFTATDK